MKILNSILEDIPEIFRLYKLATDYQRIHFPANLWPVFEVENIKKEILADLQYKIVVEREVGCIWAIAFSDPQIWEGSENDAAMYIHRIATNPDFRGNNFTQQIVDWARGFAQKQNIQYIRMDTCGNNVRLIKHYENCGFEFLGMNKLKDFTGLPIHYHNADVCFFEIKM